MKVEAITVTTSNYKVGKRTFSFDYEIHRNGDLVAKEHYNSSHTRAPQTIRKYLREGYATEIALEINAGLGSNQ